MDKFYVEGVVHLWQKELANSTLKNIKLASGTFEHYWFVKNKTDQEAKEFNNSGLPIYQPSFPSENATLQCSHCNLTFANRSEQVQHYTSDWHIANLKQTMQGLPMISLQTFLNQEESDMETSASEDDESIEEESALAKKQPRIFFVNSESKIVSIYRILLASKKTQLSSEEEIIQNCKYCTSRLYWTILIMNGGHFAAAVFQGSDVLVHKTFHSYTVRAKQGGVQSAQDGKKGSNRHPHSAGASLRRYNERAHKEHIQEILEEWRPHLTHCDLIFCRTPANNQNVLFSGGKTPFVKRTDSRLRNIPFPTMRSTFKEVKRIHALLSQVLIHGDESSFTTIQNSIPKTKKKETSPSKSRRPRRAGKKSKLQKGSNSNSSDSEIVDSNDGLENEMEQLGLNTSDKENVNMSGKLRLASAEELRALNEERAQHFVTNHIYSLCRNGKLQKLKNYMFHLQEKRHLSDCDSTGCPILSYLDHYLGPIIISDIRFPPLYKSALHVAAQFAHKQIIRWLLDEGCDPCIRDSKGRLPYSYAIKLNAKDAFKSYRAEFPDKYNYNKAKIPAPLTPEQIEVRKQKSQENLEVKRAKKAKKKEEEEKRRVREEKERKEEEERQKFLLLSDREKRALAAERRIQQQQQQQRQSVDNSNRCYQCGNVMNCEPFHYYEFKFCSTVCLRQHRK